MTLKHTMTIQELILNKTLLPVFDVVADAMKLARIKQLVRHVSNKPHG